MSASEWTPSYSPWRHGGWYVDNVSYPSGGVGCVSRRYPDQKWRVVCAEGADAEITYANRDAAARAERQIALRAWDRERPVCALCAEPVGPDEPHHIIHVGRDKPLIEHVRCVDLPAAIAGREAVG